MPPPHQSLSRRDKYHMLLAGHHLDSLLTRREPGSERQRQPCENGIFIIVFEVRTDRVDDLKCPFAYGSCVSPALSLSHSLSPCSMSKVSTEPRVVACCVAPWSGNDAGKVASC